MSPDSPAETCINTGKSSRKPGAYQNPPGVRQRGHGSGRASVCLHELPTAETVDLDLDDPELARLGKEGISDADRPAAGAARARPCPAAHDPRLFLKRRAGNRQMWRSSRLPRPGASTASTRSLPLRWTTMSPTGSIRPTSRQPPIQSGRRKGTKDICVTVFTDNSGAIIFDDHYLVTHKVETHNSPSALDPFGGALTGIVGVNRDTIGFGLGAKPCINVYGYCVGDPDTDPALFRGKDRTNPILSPRQILDGVVRGVGVGGNCSGIPTPQGWCWFDHRYGGKPLVFAGTVGVMPREHDGRKLYEKQAEARRPRRDGGRTRGQGRDPRRHLLFGSPRSAEPGDRGPDRRPDHPEEVLGCDRQGGPGPRAVPQHHGQRGGRDLLFGCRDGKGVQRLSCVSRHGCP